jgi:hypothetical protein
MGDLLSEADRPFAHTIAEVLYGYRDLNKTTTMTFSYGKDIGSFFAEIEQAMYVKNEEAISLIDSFNLKRNRGEELTPEETDKDNAAKAYKNAFLNFEQQTFESKMGNNISGTQVLAKVLLEPYKASMVSVLGKRGIQSNRIMKGAAGLAAIADQLLTIEGPTGMSLHFGGSVPQVYDELVPVRYTMGGERKKAVSYGVDRFSAASVYTTTDGERQYARKAMNGAQVGSVQAIDAATVAKTFSGPSWDKLTQASNGNPYGYPIYDAFKMDVHGYDTMLEEVNNNWFYSSLNYNYLEKAKESSEKTMTEFANKLRVMIKEGNKPVDVGPNSRFAMLSDLIKVEQDQFGKPQLPNLSSFFYQTLDLDPLSSAKDRREVAQGVAMAVAKEAKAAGVKFDGKDMRPSEILALTYAITKQLNLKTRMNKTIAEVEKGKLELEKEYNRTIRYNKEYIEEAGFDMFRPAFPLQYYAH